jgi:hypothetical protein
MSNVSDWQSNQTNATSYQGLPHESIVPKFESTLASLCVILICFACMLLGRAIRARGQKRLDRMYSNKLEHTDMVHHPKPNKSRSKRCCSFSNPAPFGTRSRRYDFENKQTDGETEEFQPPSVERSVFAIGGDSSSDERSDADEAGLSINNRFV